MEFKKGMRLPDARIASMGGNSVAFSDFRRKKVLVYGWASWDPSREALPLLQRFCEKNASDSFEVVTVAFDLTGPGRPMQYLRAAGASFQILIDATCTLSRRWGVRRLPFSLLLDEDLTVQLSGTRLDESFLKQVASALKKKSTVKGKPLPLPKDMKKQFAVEVLLQGGANFLTRQRTVDAVNLIQQAQALDPENRMIPPQILVIQNPEKFYTGKIDQAWMTAQGRLS